MCGDKYVPIQVDMFQDRIMDVVLIIKHMSKSVQDYLVPRRYLKSNSRQGMFHTVADVKLKKKMQNVQLMEHLEEKKKLMNL